MQAGSSLNSICANTLSTDPDQPAIHYETQWFTWLDMHRVATQLGALIDNSESGKNPTVAFVARNRTSDLAVIDEEGFLFLRARADGAIIRGGFKLVPAVIESALLKNPQIAMASVVGISDERLGQVPAAAIVLKPGAGQITADDIEKDLRRHVPATYIPATWQLLNELPRTPSMKVDIPAVKRIFEE